MLHISSLVRLTKKNNSPFLAFHLWCYSPNVGKSSFLNAVFGGMRAIVSDIAGTTRDSIDAVMERPPPPGSDEQSTIYRFVDTAGIRRKGKVQFGPEFFMVNRALRAIRRADIGMSIDTKRTFSFGTPHSIFY